MNKEKSLSIKAGKNLRIIINKNKITQEQASNMLNIEERTLRRWLKEGINKISTLEMICHVFNIDKIENLLR